MIKTNTKWQPPKLNVKTGGVFYDGKILNVGHTEKYYYVKGKKHIESINIVYIEGAVVDLDPMANSACDVVGCVGSYINNQIKQAIKGVKYSIRFLNTIGVAYE